MADCGVYTVARYRFGRWPINQYDPNHAAIHQSPDGLRRKRRYPSSMLRTAQIRFSWRMVNPKGKPSWRSVGCTRLRFAGAAGGRLINTIRIMRRFTNRPTDCGAKRRYPSSVLRTARTGSRPDGGRLTRRVNRHGGLWDVHGCALQIPLVAG